MNYQIAPPSECLSPLVKHYWGLENCLPAGQEHIQRIVPNGLPQLMFFLDEIPHSEDRELKTDDHSVVSGMLSRFYDIRVTGRMTIFSVIFNPDVIYSLFSIPAPELSNRNVPLSFLLKDIVPEIEDRLSESGSFENRVRVIEEILVRLLVKSHRRENRRRIGSSIPLINRCGGTASVETLASHACYSRKQYERIFADHVGLTPKQFQRVVRFQHAIHVRSVNPGLPLTTLAYECGYYDQSHMISEFREFSGVTPKEFFSACEVFSDYFAAI